MPLVVVVVMGVAGSGKSTVGASLARALGARFVDGDELHPTANVDKMARGEPLDEEDRRPWYEAIAAELERSRVTGEDPLVLACSALRRAHRDLLRRAGGEVRFLYLRGDAPVIGPRLRARQGHFFGPALLDSQLADLEEPTRDEEVLVADVADPPEAIVAAAAAALSR